MTTIKLTKNLETLISDSDYELLSAHKWYAHKGTSGHYYAATMLKTLNGKRQRLFMHRLINNTPKGFETDHINGNSLDNQRNNLRTTTKSQNQHNSSVRKDNKSGYKGVDWHKASNRWRVRLSRDGKNIFTDYFDDKIQAAKTYNDIANKVFSEYARLNTIKETE